MVPTVQNQNSRANKVLPVYANSGLCSNLKKTAWLYFFLSPRLLFLLTVCCLGLGYFRARRQLRHCESQRLVPLYVYPSAGFAQEMQVGGVSSIYLGLLASGTSSSSPEGSSRFSKKKLIKHVFHFLQQKRTPSRFQAIIRTLVYGSPLHLREQAHLLVSHASYIFSVSVFLTIFIVSVI